MGEKGESIGKRKESAKGVMGERKWGNHNNDEPTKLILVGDNLERPFQFGCLIFFYSTYIIFFLKLNFILIA